MSNQNENPIINTYGNVYNWQIVEVMPLQNIPVETEDTPVHTAENGYVCGDPTCYCATYGYGEEVQ